jgi:hypothetical protein
VPSSESRVRAGNAHQGTQTPPAPCRAAGPQTRTDTAGAEGSGRMHQGVRESGCRSARVGSRRGRADSLALSLLDGRARTTAAKDTSTQTTPAPISDDRPAQSRHRTGRRSSQKTAAPCSAALRHRVVCVKSEHVSTPASQPRVGATVYRFSHAVYEELFLKSRQHAVFKVELFSAGIAEVKTPCRGRRYWPEFEPEELT